jgi:hypothetical protein
VGNFTNFENVDVTACKYEDYDGDGGMDEAIPGWTVYLTVDDVRVDTQTTGANGCYTWENLGPLAAGSFYDVAEDDPAPEWTATSPLSVDFESPPQSGASYLGNFTNFKNVDVQACKLRDYDGDLVTEDWEVVSMWPVHLTIDGAIVDSQETGADGCYTWENLGPLTHPSYYDVEEDVLFGWVALTPTGYDFAPPVSGGFYTYTFINFREPGCALTFGYWKNHDWDSNHFDDTWDEIGEETEFFDTGINWNDILDIPPSGGNAYYILAHQYIAAILNSKKADHPADTTLIEGALGQAEALLDAYDTYDGGPYIPADGVLVSGDDDRALAISIADTLDQFNNGVLPGGPTHCDG